jgi:hypothetical protein
MLDETDPYYEVAVSGRGPHTIITSDSPSNSLNPSELTDADDQYRMFLMWRPDRYGGRFRISVARIKWWWKGTAEADNANADCQEGQRGWKLTTPPSEHGGDDNGVATLQRPVTSRNIATVKAADWQPC